MNNELYTFEYKNHIIYQIIMCWQIRYFVYGEADMGFHAFNNLDEAEDYINNYFSNKKDNSNGYYDLIEKVIKEKEYN